MFQITLFEKPKRDGPLSKVITLDADGKPVSDGSYCLMVEGTASALGVKDMAALAWLIDSMVSPQHAIALGRLANGVIGPVPVTAVRRLRKGNRSPDTIARTKQYLVFIDDIGMMLLDFDTKGMPASVASKLNANGGFEATLFLILPELKGSERLVRDRHHPGFSSTEMPFPVPAGSTCWSVLPTHGIFREQQRSCINAQCWPAMAGPMSGVPDRSCFGRLSIYRSARPSGLFSKAGLS